MVGGAGALSGALLGAPAGGGSAAIGGISGALGGGALGYALKKSDDYEVDDAKSYLKESPLDRIRRRADYLEDLDYERADIQGNRMLMNDIAMRRLK